VATADARASLAGECSRAIASTESNLGALTGFSAMRFVLRLSLTLQATRLRPSGRSPPSLQDALQLLREAASGSAHAASAGGCSSYDAKLSGDDDGLPEPLPLPIHGGVASPLPASDARFIINVSAMEGVFYRAHKTPYHPHTNAAKAAVNMSVRTSAGDAANSGVFMGAVDTGWETLEHPAHTAERLCAGGFQTPLDEVDAAARILDPIFAPLALAEGRPPIAWPPTDAPVEPVGPDLPQQAAELGTAASYGGDGPALGLCSPWFGAFLKDYWASTW
jgi:NAD(P)-dependent dehydrogenase (short-subunit alcohol dehydrogenase family)